MNSRLPISLQATTHLFPFLLAILLVAACQSAQIDLETEIDHLRKLAEEGKKELSNTREKRDVSTTNMNPVI